jgi:hypothetical protein
MVLSLHFIVAKVHDVYLYAFDYLCVHYPFSLLILLFVYSTEAL